MAKALLIKSSQVRDGKRGAWNRFDQQKPYIQGILTGELSEKIDADTLATMISGVPSPWARAKLFGFAFRYLNTDPNIKTSGLFKFYSSLISEWKGLIACMALFPTRISLSPPIYLDPEDVVSPYAPAGALARMLFDDKDLWNDSKQTKNEAKPFTQLIYYNGQLIGSISPYSIVFTSASYSSLTGAEDMKWFRLGRFDDPLEYGDLDNNQLKKLYLLANNIGKKLPKFEQVINANRGSKEQLDLIGIKEFLRKWISEIKNKGKEVSDEGTLDGELRFSTQYEDLFSLRTKFYRIGNRLSFIEPTEREKIEIDPQLLLLDSDTVVQMDQPAKGISLDESAVYLLKVYDGEKKEAAYFPLPLSKTGIDLFQKTVPELLLANVEGTHRITGYIKDSNYMLVVELQLCVDGKLITPIKREYKIDPMPTGKSAIIWPNFVSKHWTSYFLYSEFPCTDSTTKMVPFFKDENGNIIFDNGNIVYANSENAEDKAGASNVIRYDVKIADIKDHKYEIYKSRIPFAGVEIRMPIGGKEKVVGYLFVKRADDISMGDHMIKDLTHTHNPSQWSKSAERSAVVGFDFGSNNSCISYGLSRGTVVEPIQFNNRRVFLVGAERLDSKAETFAEHSELHFFQSAVPQKGQIKSYVHLHKPICVPTGLEPSEVSGGVPVFEHNIQVSSMDDSNMVTNAGIMKHNLKWTNDTESLNIKKGFLKTLWIMICAELYSKSVLPVRLKWSYPSSLSKKAWREYSVSYGETVGSTPIDMDPRPDFDKDMGSTLTESEAVCNYMFGPARLGLIGDNMILGIDVGGSTSDILLIGKVKGQATLLKQSSVRLAANKLTEVAKRSKPIQEAVAYFVSSPGSPIVVKGIDQMVKKPETTPYFLNTVFDRLHSDDSFKAFYKSIYSPKLASINKEAVQKFFLIPAYITGILLFYSGQLCSATVRSKGLTKVKMFELGTFGKGGRLFDWLEHVISRDEMLAYYNKCFKAGYGKGSEGIQLELKSEVRKDNKSEVSFGLSSVYESSGENIDIQKVVDVSQRDSIDIVGEEGFIFNGNPISADMACLPEYMKNLTRTMELPEKLVQLESFLDIFFDLVGPRDIGLIQNTDTLRKRIPEIRRKLFSYVTNDPEYKRAISSQGLKDTEFDYSQSLLILEAMCFLDEILINECFKG